MVKEKARNIRDFLVKHNKIVFPVIIVVAVAITVVIALGSGDKGSQGESMATEETEQTTSTEAALEAVSKQVPLVANEDAELYSAIATYYNAVALGDSDTLETCCVGWEQQDMLWIIETAKYIDYYSALDVYTKQGYEDGSVIAYVYFKVVFKNRTEEVPGVQTLYMHKDDGGEYIVDRYPSGTELNAYIEEVSTQDDVVELYNSVTVEYNELMSANPELLTYMAALDEQVKSVVAIELAKLQSEAENAEVTENPDAGSENGENVEEPPQDTPVYAKTTTTVNVRASDSEQAEKLGKVSGGTKIQVLENKINGWTKVLYEGKEGYIKSEYLAINETANAGDVIGTVTATTNVNVRASASETADRLGVLNGGATVDLLGREGDWSKIVYEGQVGYVKSEYLN